MSLPDYIPVDFSRYVWRARTSPSFSTDVDTNASPGPAYYTREARGGELFEDVCNRFANGDQTLFLGLQLRLASPLPTSVFMQHVKDAWAALRWAVPNLAVRTEHEEGRTLLAYRASADAEEVRKWAERTVRLRELEKEGKEKALDELRWELGTHFIPEASGDQVFLYIVPYSETEFGLLLHTSHSVMDGAGTKVLLTLFLRELAGQLHFTPTCAKKKLEEFAWGKEGENLVKCATEVAGDLEPLDGPAYESTLKTVLGDMGSYLPVRS